MVVVIKKGPSKKAKQDAWKQLAERAKPKGIDAYKYCGTASLKEDPLAIQKKWRDEWE